MMTAFLKMQGAGNDFAVFDARVAPLAFSPAQLTRIADRRLGIGCDQIIILEPSKQADVFMRIFNADGSESAACGNATRCIGMLVMQEKGADSCRIETRAGILTCFREADGRLRVDMGKPVMDWRRVAAQPEAELEQVLAFAGYGRPVLVDMGNPHAVFFVNESAKETLPKFGPRIEKHPAFTHGVNVSLATLRPDCSIALRVWERGSGLTLACGTAACATQAAAFHTGLAPAAATIHLPGGDLDMRIDMQTGHVWMTGEAILSFSGDIDL